MPSAAFFANIEAFTPRISDPNKAGQKTGALTTQTGPRTSLENNGLHTYDSKAQQFWQFWAVWGEPRSGSVPGFQECSPESGNDVALFCFVVVSSKAEAKAVIPSTFLNRYSTMNPPLPSHRPFLSPAVRGGGGRVQYRCAARLRYGKREGGQGGQGLTGLLMFFLSDCNTADTQTRAVLRPTASPTAVSCLLSRPPSPRSRTANRQRSIVNRRRWGGGQDCPCGVCVSGPSGAPEDSHINSIRLSRGRKSPPGKVLRQCGMPVRFGWDAGDSGSS